MAKLILLRHLQSQWNEENRFNGWIDTPLAQGQEEKIRKLSEELSRFKIDAIFCSRLFRNMDTVARVFEYCKKYPLYIHLDAGKMKNWGHFKDISENDIPTYVSEKLNERYYGKLQGEDKEGVIKNYGERVVHLWRRSFNVPPPGGESLKDVYNRTTPFFKKYIAKELKAGKNILVVSSHNSLRALVKYLEKISDRDIMSFEIKPGTMMEYEVDEKAKIKNKKVLE